jgi:hypothetical protein
VVRARTYTGPTIRYRVAVAEGIEFLVDQPNREHGQCGVGDPVMIWWDADDALVVTGP